MSVDWLIDWLKLNVSGTCDVGTQDFLYVKIIMFGWCASGVHPRRRPGDPRRPPGPPGRAHPPRLVDPRRALLYRNGFKISQGKDAILIREKIDGTHPATVGFHPSPRHLRRKIDRRSATKNYSNQAINQSIDQWSNQWIKQAINQSINRIITWSIHLSLKRLRAIGRLQRGVVPLIGEGYLFHTEKETSLFIFSIVTLMFVLTFDRNENKKEVTGNFPGFFIPERGILGSPFKTTWPKNLKFCFL